MAKYLIVEGERWDVTRTDGDQRIGGYHRMGCESLALAEEMVEIDVTRNQLGPSEMSIRRKGSKAIEVKTVMELSVA